MSLVLFLILRYLSDLRRPHKRQVKPSVIVRGLAAGEKSVLLLGHKWSKSRWKKFPVTKSVFQKHTYSCLPELLLCFVMETPVEQIKLKCYQGGQCVQHQLCRVVCGLLREKQRGGRFFNTLLNSILRHGYQRSIFLPLSLLFAQNFLRSFQ